MMPGTRVLKPSRSIRPNRKVAMGDKARLRQLALWFAILLLPCVLLARRFPLFIQPSFGGVAVWQALPVLSLIPILVALHSLFADPTGVRRVLRLPGAWVVFACLGADLFVYILSAWKAHSAPLGVDLVMRVIPSTAAILIGVFMWKSRPAALHGLVATSVISSAIAGIFQMSQRAGLDTLPGRWLLAWDTAQLSELAMNYSRVQGFETNPNMYSPMAAVGILWALFGMPRGPLRSATIAASVVISVLSQSRTTMLVILGLMAVSAVGEWSGRSPVHLRKHVLLLATIVGALAVGLIAVRFGPVALTPAGPVSQNAAINTSQPADIGRLDAMRASVDAIAKNPWGYFERSHEITAPLWHPHNEALYRTLYAGPLWLAAHAVFLLWLALWLKSKRYPWTGVAIAVALFINGFTEPLYPMYPYLILLYLIIGAMMWTKSAEQTVPLCESSD